MFISDHDEQPMMSISTHHETSILGACRLEVENCFNEGIHLSICVGKFTTHRASNFQQVQLLSTNGPQQLQ
jgi:hypothetical protein